MSNERAFNIGEFCRRYGIGRTTAYAEVKAGRLALLKVGRRSLVTHDDAERWLRNLVDDVPEKPRSFPHHLVGAEQNRDSR
jgi:excisionase family DNA binding protein